MYNCELTIKMSLHYHTIIGSTGPIGEVIAKELHQLNKSCRLVSRNPKQINGADELVNADVSKLQNLDDIVKDSEVVYVAVSATAYTAKVWKVFWPTLITKLIDSCAKHNAKLIFFDNPYMWGKGEINHITEDAPMHPTSKKGKIRLECNQMIMKAVEDGKIQAIIAHAPGFFGPCPISFINIAIHDNIARGKQANWFGRSDVINSNIWVSDAAKGCVMLAMETDTWNQHWNLPTSSEKLTINQYASLFYKELNVVDKGVSCLSSTMVWFLGFFDSNFMSGMYEMMYNFESDFYFDSSKFNQRFNFTPMTAEQGVKITVAHYKAIEDAKKAARVRK